MKVKALVVALLVAGIAASLALAKAPKSPKPPKPAATTTTAAKPAKPAKPKCDQVELKGNATAGSITFTVAKANKRGRTLVGTTVTLTVPAGAKIKAKACTTPGSSTLTLRDLHVKVPRTP
jgi:hypothetical protein